MVVICISRHELEPTVGEKAAYYKQVREGQVRFLGGTAVRLRDGAVVMIPITPVQQRADELVRTERVLASPSTPPINEPEPTDDTAPESSV